MIMCLFLISRWGPNAPHILSEKHAKECFAKDLIKTKLGLKSRAVHDNPMLD